MKDDVIKTPPPDAGILQGLTRDTVIRLARSGGRTVLETTMIRHDIYVADECFLTGTAAEVIAVVSLDGRRVGEGKPGPVTKELLKRFQLVTRGEG